MEKTYSLGIDTSNYKTSIAVIDCTDGTIVCNFQKYLEVKKGERGLRQSTALFQHINNIPVLFSKVCELDSLQERIGVVAVSSKPRPVQGSYMPVFNAGLTAAKLISSSLGVNLFEFSHQEGHIEAIKHYSPLSDRTSDFISFHFSGGTTEALKVSGNLIEIVGGTRDIAFGQLIDRVGVSLGLPFPCGEAMDKISMNIEKNIMNILPTIKISNGYFNLSGIETRCQRLIGTTDKDELVFMIFEKIGQCIINTMNQINQNTGINDFLFAGGVASSRYIKNFIINNTKAKTNVFFGKPELSIDNAVGIALLGGKNQWH